MGQRCLGTLLLAVGLGSRRAGRGSNIRSFAFVAVSNARKHPPTGAELAKKRETPIVSGPLRRLKKPQNIGSWAQAPSNLRALLYGNGSRQRMWRSDIRKR